MKGYDYTNSGLYFVTIDVQDKLELFWGDNEINHRKGGHIGPPVHKLQNINQPVHEMQNFKSYEINNIGEMVNYWWLEIENHFNNVFLDEYVIMPDHFHGIININNNVGADRCVRPLGILIQWFKTMTTNQYLKNIKSNNWPRFHKRLWQRNYFEHIIRDEFELNRIRKYILDNPEKLGS